MIFEGKMRTIPRLNFIGSTNTIVASGIQLRQFGGRSRARPEKTLDVTKVTFLAAFFVVSHFKKPRFKKPGLLSVAASGGL